MSQYDKTTEAKAENYAVEHRGYDFHFGEFPLAGEQIEAFKAGRASAKESLEIAVRALETIAQEGESEEEK